MPLIQRQKASGGGMIPEDVLCAFDVAQSQLEWRGDVRLALLVADAPGHGYGLPGVADEFPDGCAPDQPTPLADVARRLAHERGVDLIMTRLGKARPCPTKLMEDALRDIYDTIGTRRGFGAIAMPTSADAFKVRTWI